VTLTAEWSGQAVSINERLRRGATSRRIGAARYQAFKHSMAWALRAEVMRQRWQPIGAYTLRLELALPRRMDHDNVEKAAIDALTIAGVLRDDNPCRGKEVIPLDPRSPAWIRWTVTAKGGT
jgi:Holliday junction resolvase RusA-like endonuclease